MAQRPVYTPIAEGTSFVAEREVEFHWYPGFSLQQKQRSIAALHAAAADQYGVAPLLEISSKSPVSAGIALSAFNLMLADSSLAFPISVEAAFQGSKVFAGGGPYVDLYEQSPRDAKRDPRLQQSGALKSFEFAGERWPLEPRTLFYDWLYLKALRQHNELAQNLLGFAGFTDIEFNPKRSINCQARSAALYVSLARRGFLREGLATSERYRQLMTGAARPEPEQHRLSFADWDV
jgi:hypothetical protein